MEDLREITWPGSCSLGSLKQATSEIFLRFKVCASLNPCRTLAGRLLAASCGEAFGQVVQSLDRCRRQLHRNCRSLQHNGCGPGVACRKLDGSVDLQRPQNVRPSSRKPCRQASLMYPFHKVCLQAGCCKPAEPQVYIKRIGQTVLHSTAGLGVILILPKVLTLLPMHAHSASPVTVSTFKASHQSWPLTGYRPLIQVSSWRWSWEVKPGPATLRVTCFSRRLPRSCEHPIQNPPSASLRTNTRSSLRKLSTGACWESACVCTARPGIDARILKLLRLRPVFMPAFGVESVYMTGHAVYVYRRQDEETRENEIAC